MSPIIRLIELLLELHHSQRSDWTSQSAATEVREFEERSIVYWQVLSLLEHCIEFIVRMVELTSSRIYRVCHCRRMHLRSLGSSSCEPQILHFDCHAGSSPTPCPHSFLFDRCDVLLRVSQRVAPFRPCSQPVSADVRWHVYIELCWTQGWKALIQILLGIYSLFLWARGLVRRAWSPELRKLWSIVP